MRVSIRGVRMFEDKIFLLIDGGFIQVLNKKTGEYLWRNEVRGERIINFQVYKNRVYLTSNDGRIYCLRMETGEILWEFFTEGDHYIVLGSEQTAFSSAMEDNVIFIITWDGRLFALSRYPLFQKLCEMVHFEELLETAL